MIRIRNFLPTALCGWTFLVTAASAQAPHELRCRGGKGAFVFDHPSKSTLSLSFVASSRAAGANGQDLEAGTCAWTDRTLNDGESRQIQFAVGASDAISIPNYLDDSNHYWTFLVTGTNKDHFESKGHSGVTNAESVASPGQTQNSSPGQPANTTSGGTPGASPGGIPGGIPGGVPGGIPGGIPGGSLGGIPGASVGGLPGASVGGIPSPSVGGLAAASPGGIPGFPTRGGWTAKFKGKLRRLALDTARVSQINKLIRGDVKPGEQAPEDTALPVITDVAAAIADQSVIFSFTTKPASLPLVELAQTLPVMGPDKRLGFQVGPGLVAHPAEGDSVTGEYWVDMNQKLEPGKIYYYIISAWKDNNPNAPRSQVVGSFSMPVAEATQPSEIIPP